MMPLSFSISTGIGLGLIMLSVLIARIGFTGRKATAVTPFWPSSFLLHFFEPLIVRWLGASN